MPLAFQKNKFLRFNYTLLNCRFSSSLNILLLSIIEQLKSRPTVRTSSSLSLKLMLSPEVQGCKGTRILSNIFFFQISYHSTLLQLSLFWTSGQLAFDWLKMRTQSKIKRIKKSKNQKIKKIKSINDRVWRHTTIILFPQKCIWPCCACLQLNLKENWGYVSVLMQFGNLSPVTSFIINLV